jgi:hypothetical protein
LLLLLLLLQRKKTEMEDLFSTAHDAAASGVTVIGCLLTLIEAHLICKQLMRKHSLQLAAVMCAERCSLLLLLLLLSLLLLLPLSLLLLSLLPLLLLPLLLSLLLLSPLQRKKTEMEDLVLLLLLA